MKQVKYSFVLPAFKGQFLKEAIDSILQQTYIDFELVVVNDFSPDNITQIVSFYNDSRIRYYENNHNIGGSDLVKNWNKCIKYAQGNYLILASDDDVYHKNYLKEIDLLVSDYPSVDVFRARVQKIDSKGNVTDVDFLYPKYMTQPEFVYYMTRGMIKCIANYTFRLPSLLNNDGFVNFPCAYFSDDATVQLLSVQGCCSTTDVLFGFRSSDNNISMNKKTSVLENRVKAIDLYYKWTLVYYKDVNKIFLPYQNPLLHIHNNLFTALKNTISDFPLRSIGYVLKSMIMNKFLYKREKVYIIINYLFSNIGH